MGPPLLCLAGGPPRLMPGRGLVFGLRPAYPLLRLEVSRRVEHDVCVAVAPVTQQPCLGAENVIAGRRDLVAMLTYVSHSLHSFRV